MKNMVDLLNEFQRKNAESKNAIHTELLDNLRRVGGNLDGAIKEASHLLALAKDRGMDYDIYQRAYKTLQNERDNKIKLMMQQPFGSDGAEKLSKQNDRLQEQLQRTIDENLMLKRALLATILESGKQEFIVRDTLARAVFGMTDDEADELKFSVELKYDESARIFYNYHEFREDVMNFRPTLNPQDVVPPRGKEHLYKKGGHKL